MDISRRDLIVTAAAAGLVPARRARAQAAAPFTFDTVREMAADLAKRPYAEPADTLPGPLRNLDDLHYRMIDFRSDRAIWHDAGLFQLELYHRGFVYDRRVVVNTIENGQVAEIGYSPDEFDFGDSGIKEEFKPDLGFSGFRLRFPLNQANVFDEFASFHGASYFKLVGRGEHYGLSARGLAIDTAGPQGEEFPWFREFWVVRPADGQTAITVYGLLDSRSTAGAYRITIQPQSQTVATVDATLYTRADIKKLGLAPLGSMFLHGKPENRPFLDIRPEAHDSDGLMLHTGSGEWIWRPLTNPKTLQISSFADTNPHGFGLSQRERDWRQYQDPPSLYQTRPSAWIEPEGDWGRGRVELVEIPSDQEVNDNIVSYWVPDQPIAARQIINFGYRLRLHSADVLEPPTGRCVATRTAPATPTEMAREERHGPHRFAVAFGGGEIPTLGAHIDVQANFITTSGKISDMVSEKLGPDEWRASFTFTPDGGADADLRGFLALRGAPLTETWSYHWSGA